MRESELSARAGYRIGQHKAYDWRRRHGRLSGILHMVDVVASESRGEKSTQPYGVYPNDYRSHQVAKTTSKPSLEQPHRTNIRKTS